MNIDNGQQFLITPAVAEDLARRYRESCERRRAAAQARQLESELSKASIALLKTAADLFLFRPSKLL